MIKKLTTTFALMLSAVTFSQVGIGTENPHASSDLELASPDKALYLNRVAEPENDIADPQPGMLLYDTTLNCMRVYQGEPAAWSACIGLVLSGSEGSIDSFDCASAAFSPASANENEPYSGTLSIPYTGGDGGTYPEDSFTVGGLDFHLPEGNFATGNGTLIYQITGTPTASGTIIVDINQNGASCTGLTLNVNQDGSGVLPSTISLAQNRRHWIASVYDTDYLPYTIPGAPASTDVINADSTPDAVTIDVQGSITETGITVQIPVASVTGNGTVGAWVSTFVAPAMYAEDGQSRTLELSWTSQSYTTASKYITATIKSLGGTFNAKKLDINAGIGNDYLGLLLGKFQYPYNNAGTLTDYEVRDIPGIPDRMFGLPDNAGNNETHLMLYLPIQAEDGNIWLNNNLGAHYSDINHASFNPAQQAINDTDYLAFGSLFQWGRKSDGHELMTRTGSGNSQVTPIYTDVVTTRQTEPLTITSFISRSGTGLDWRTPSNNMLWSGENAVNNPCPVGFRVPSEADADTLRLITGNEANSVLQFTKTGYRNSALTTFTQTGTYGYYWTSTASIAGDPGNTADAHAFRIGTSGGGHTRSTANAIRCMKD